MRHPQGTTQREPTRSDEIPKRNMPPQQMRCRLPPLVLRLQHVQRATHDKPTAANDLWNPVGRVQPPLWSEMVDYAW